MSKRKAPRAKKGSAGKPTTKSPAKKKKTAAHQGSGSPKPGNAPKPSPHDIVEASFVAAADNPESLPAQLGVEVAFAGRSNVGKSSLLNALMRRKNLVRTSSTPGCTRQINFFQARARDEASFQLVDLPGYGYAKRSKSERSSWATMIDYYLLQRDWLRALVLLVDARRGIEAEDEGLVTLMKQRAQPAALIVVATKIDKVPKSKRRAVLHKLTRDGGVAIGTSAVQGDGLEPLWRAIRLACHLAPQEAQP